MHGRYHIEVLKNKTNIVEMANSQPSSMIISSNALDETNTNGSKSVVQKKDSLPLRSSNQAKLPGTNITIAHSSSSSIDSTGAKLTNSNDKTSSLPQISSLTTVSSTTTDSELESEQEERYTDDNNSLELNNLPKQIRRPAQQEAAAARRDSGQQKSEGNTSEQLSRRVKHFQKLFKSEIADDDMPELIDSYVCAYQGDILLQGKMYITDRYLCFHSRIISYVTKHVYRWEQIDNVTKERVAFIFPTAIGIQLKPTGKKIIYASFLQRDQAYDKIISICSRFNNETGSIADDDDNRLIPNGTLKSQNSNQNFSTKSKKSKRNHYETPDDSEHDNVLQMCLGQDRTNSLMKRRKQPLSSKTDDDKQQQTKKLFNSDKKKTNSIAESNLSSDFNADHANRMSRHSKNQPKQTDTFTRDNPSLRSRQSSRNRDRTLSPSHRSLANLSPLESLSDRLITDEVSNINSDNNGFVQRYFRIILLSIISIIRLLIEYLLLLLKQFRIYPIKTSFILLLFVIILVIHSFYLIKLAYRIESRLQSLHHVWPLPSSSMESSIPSSNKFS
ncbi:unnamed protein product [Adineta ricciae]|uniref:GRAM domain-containing protein n=1 Tax=Adineta ricciae TaxID=249248 RepID=A0A815DMX8_ADIRI|nr:unnamed protein product [Adineta ricciae]